MMLKRYNKYVAMGVFSILSCYVGYKSISASSVQCVDATPLSQIETIDSLSQVRDALCAAGAKTLIVWDVDETLITPDTALWQQGRIWEVDYTKDLPFSKRIDCSNERNQGRERLDMLSQRLLSCKYQLVEDITATTIQEIQAKDIKVIALTNMGPGEFGSVTSIKEWRWEQLNAVGIDFDTSFPMLSMTLDQLPSVQSGYPELYRGILFAANNSKGEVLAVFLDQIDWKPTKVIFIDDRVGYIDSVQEEMAMRNIPFQGYLYNGAEKYKKELDLAIVAYQVEYLNEHDAVISDAEVQALLGNIKNESLSA